jgi:hypothetical protein
MIAAGAVGTPIWFGFGELGLGEDNLQLVGVKASILVGACAFVIAPLAASFLVSCYVIVLHSITHDEHVWLIVDCILINCFRLWFFKCALLPGYSGAPCGVGCCCEDNLQLVGVKASILVGACAFVIAPLAASFLVSFIARFYKMSRCG